MGQTGWKTPPIPRYITPCMDLELGFQMDAAFWALWCALCTSVILMNVADELKKWFDR